MLSLHLYYYLYGVYYLVQTTYISRFAIPHHVRLHSSSDCYSVIVPKFNQTTYRTRRFVLNSFDAVPLVAVIRSISVFASEIREFSNDSSKISTADLLQIRFLLLKDDVYLKSEIYVFMSFFLKKEKLVSIKTNCYQ